MPRRRPFSTAQMHLAAAFVLVAVLAWIPPAHGDNALPEHVSTPYLAFDLPTGRSDRKVFAHYVPFFPVSIDNLPADIDYYTTEFLSPNGERGKYRDSGGYLRDRPLARDPINSPDWRDIDVRTEINQAKSVGIDGFAMDVIEPRSKSDVADRLLVNANVVGDFTILVTADMSGPFGSSSTQAFADEFAHYLSAPGAFKLTDGRPVLGAFAAELIPVSWWRETLALLNARLGAPVAFVPTFLNGAEALDSFAPLAYGFSNWGGRSPSEVPVTDTGPTSPVALAMRSHALGKTWMQPVAFQDNRPRDGGYWESENSTTNTNAWQVAIGQHADWVQLLTWNDYSETTALAPSAKHRWSLLDMNAFGIAYYKYGQPPPITRDAIYVSHRTQPAAALPSFPETKLMTLAPGSSPTRDDVEVVTYAVAPATVAATIGSQTLNCSVPAGLGVCRFPVAPGSVIVGLFRDGGLKAAASSPFRVTEKPYVQDLQYVVAGGLR